MKNFPLSSFARYRFNGITRCRPVVWANFVSFVDLTLYFRKAPIQKGSFAWILFVLGVCAILKAQ